MHEARRLRSTEICAVASQRPVPRAPERTGHRVAGGRARVAQVAAARRVRLPPGPSALLATPWAWLGGSRSGPRWGWPGSAWLSGWRLPLRCSRWFTGGPEGRGRPVLVPRQGPVLA